MEGMFKGLLQVIDGPSVDDMMNFDCDIEIDGPVQSDLCWLYVDHLAMLIEKNKRYGNSALDPIGIFNKSNPEAGLLIRIDDKLKRIEQNDEIRKNDVSDLIGYLMLYCVSQGWVNHQDLID